MKPITVFRETYEGLKRYWQKSRIDCIRIFRPEALTLVHAKDAIYDRWDLPLEQAFQVAKERETPSLGDALRTLKRERDALKGLAVKLAGYDSGQFAALGPLGFLEMVQQARMVLKELGIDWAQTGERS